MEASRMKIIYGVLDRHCRAAHCRIGLAFVDSDGSMRVKLDAIPLSGEMLIVDYTPTDYSPTEDCPAEARIGSCEARVFVPGTAESGA